ncbi:MAG: TonB-dependent receptor plug domain-containing protein, partial [Myxococcaceae bacterium]|nr:TonB-dependent receptor plug domain-containing protein [Myxococcaceae bacterium]
MLPSVLLLTLACLDDAGTCAPSSRCDGGVEYPASERATGIAGAMTVRVSVPADGGAVEFTMVDSLGPAFEREAARALGRCAFGPATLSGTPVGAALEVRFDFTPPVLPWTLAGEVVGEFGEPLSGAQVRFSDREAVTDAQGRFTLVLESVDASDAWVLVSHDGHALKAFPEVFRSGETTKVQFGLVRQRGFETRVEGSRLLPSVPDADRTPTVSRYSLTRADIDRTPGALEDIARVVQQLPGVAADPDLLANFFVRGGGPDETLVLVDGVPLSNPYHLGGFASIINPLLVESADFYAGPAPARYEPALSGVLDIRYPRATPKKVSVVADVSLLSAKARADVPLGVEGLSAIVSVRRTFLEAYFAVLKALQVFGQSVVAPDLTEAFTRLSYRRGPHLTMLTFTHASDGFRFIVKPGEEVLVNFAGNLTLSNSAQIVSLRHEVDLPGESELSFTAAYLRDQNVFDVQGTIDLATAALRHDVVARADLTWVFSERYRSTFGVQYASRQTALEGTVADARGAAPWAQLPIVETYREALPIRPAFSRNLLSLSAEHTLRPLRQLTLEAGGRAQLELTQRQLSGSARLAGALALPTLTVLKLSGGLALQPVGRALALDPTFGVPSLAPERTLSAVAAVEQPLPFEALLRLEGWSKWYQGLVVNPDTGAGVASREAQGLPVFTNDGFGHALGVDLLLVGRLRRFSYSLGAGVLRADRTNPLADGPRTYQVQWEQQLSTGASLSFSPSAKWVFTARG